MKKHNFKIVQIDNNKKLFNYEKKILIKDITLDLQLGYYDYEKEKKQKVKFNLEVNYEDKKPTDDKDLKSIVNYAKIVTFLSNSGNLDNSGHREAISIFSGAIERK